MRNNRWYDAYPNFAYHLEKCKYLIESDLEKVMDQIKSIIMDYNADLLEKHVKDFPLDSKKRRWYDKNPYSWMVVNSIKFVDEVTIENITEFIDEHVRVVLK
ncbi:MAG: hypothetical protein MJB14_22090 [Spirochaetes bacterium]|nr:hypothetical protein [Spirochaetota bacterium]